MTGKILIGSEWMTYSQAVKTCPQGELYCLAERIIDAAREGGCEAEVRAAFHELCNRLISRT